MLMSDTLLIIIIYLFILKTILLLFCLGVVDSQSTGLKSQTCLTAHSCWCTVPHWSAQSRVWTAKSGSEGAEAGALWLPATHRNKRPHRYYAQLFISSSTWEK